MIMRRQAVGRSEYYIAAMRRWVPFLWKEPHALLAGSGWFMLTCLPLVTFGPALIALTHYMRLRERGIKVSWRQATALAFRQCGARGWLMGLTDGLALFMAGGCALSVLEEGLPLPIRLIYALLFIVDLLYLMSGMYRYPALNAEPGAKVGMMAARGFLMALNNLGWTLMFFFAQLLALMICALTGVGLFILYPAAAALLAACAYESMLRQYLPDTQDAEEEQA